MTDGIKLLELCLSHALSSAQRFPGNGKARRGPLGLKIPKHKFEAGRKEWLAQLAGVINLAVRGRNLDTAGLSNAALYERFFVDISDPPRCLSLTKNQVYGFETGWRMVRQYQVWHPVVRSSFL